MITLIINNFTSMSSLTGLLNQISDMIVAMGSNVPFNTIKKITDLIMNNPPIFTQACDLIERSMASVVITKYVSN